MPKDTPAAVIERLHSAGVETLNTAAVAERLKQRSDAPIIVFGGANCEGEMGLQLIRSFDCIDFICCGEADVSFIRLLDRLLGSVVRRSVKARISPERSPVRSMMWRISA